MTIDRLCQSARGLESEAAPLPSRFFRYGTVAGRLSACLLEIRRRCRRRPSRAEVTPEAISRESCFEARRRTLAVGATSGALSRRAGRGGPPTCGGRVICVVGVGGSLVPSQCSAAGPGPGLAGALPRVPHSGSMKFQKLSLVLRSQIRAGSSKIGTAGRRPKHLRNISNKGGVSPQL